MTALPKVKNKNLVEKNLGIEILLYDLKLNKAYCLNETAAVIYQNCNGRATFDELKKHYNYTDDLICLTLGELCKINLIESTDYSSPFGTLPRREIIKRVGLGTLAALPFISSLAAPSAINAQSVCRTNGQTCDDAGDFTQRNCCPTLRCGTNCFRCSTGGFTFSDTALFCTGTQASCESACNAAIRKNTCCNSGMATVSLSGPNAYSCVCP